MEVAVKMPKVSKVKVKPTDATPISTETATAAPVPRTRQGKVPAMLKSFIKAAEPEIDVPEAESEHIKPLYAEGEELPEPIAALGIAQRPLVWRDLADFRARHGRSQADIVYDLALPPNGIAGKAESGIVLSFDLEILVRLYDLYPASCAWTRPDAREMFKRLYGDAIAKFEPEDQPAAQLAFSRRYVTLLGRSDTAHYRWLPMSGKVRNIPRRMSNILSKIDGILKAGQDARSVFEELAKHTWSLRGVDIEQVLPNPDAQTIRRPPGSKGRKVSKGKAIIGHSLNAPKYLGGAFS